MPTYEYRCTSCRHVFARVEPISEHGRRRPPCPRCKSARTEQLLSASFVKTVKKS